MPARSKKDAKEDMNINSSWLFDVALSDPGKKAWFAGRALIDQQRLTNWRRRGVPWSAVPMISRVLDISPAEFLDASGVHIAPHTAREGRVAYAPPCPRCAQLSDAAVQLAQKIDGLPQSERELLERMYRAAVPDERLGAEWTRPDRK